MFRQLVDNIYALMTRRSTARQPGRDGLFPGSGIGTVLPRVSTNSIAGLLEDTSNQTDNAVPGLGEVPFIGALFRGDSFAREQQELVITVTPYLVNPVSNPAALVSPDDGWTPPNDLQRILLLRDSGTVAANTVIPGDAGFLVQ